MHRIVLSALLTGILLVFAGCGGGAHSDEIKLSSETPVEAEAPANPPIETPPVENTAETPAASNVEQRLGDAVKDVYAGIEIDAFVRERMAILPGFAVPVTVTVKNTGNEKVDYIRGSGRYTTPEALFINIDGLQPVMPEDHLGPVTMDFSTGELKPGDTLEYVMYIMAIEPNAQFDAYTVETHVGGEYIAKKGWDELQKKFPDLIPAKSGSYQGHAYFMYYTQSGAGISKFTEMPNGYAEHDFKIGVS